MRHGWDCFANLGGRRQLAARKTQNGTLRFAMVHIVDTPVPIFLTPIPSATTESSIFLRFEFGPGIAHLDGVTKTLQVPGETIAPRFAVLPTESPRIEICPLPL